MGPSGGLPAQPEEEAQGLLLEVSLSPSFLSVSMWLSTSFYTPTPVLFHLLGFGSTEKGGHPMGESPEIRNGGTSFGDWWLGEDGSSSGRFRGRGFLWASEGAMLHSPYPQPHLLIRRSVTPLLPPSPICPLRSPQDLTFLNLQIRWWTISPAAPPVSEEAIPTHMQPICIQLGASNEYTSARLRATRRAHQPPVLLFVHMYAKCTWGWGLCAPLAASPSSTQILSSTTRKAFLINKVREKRGSVNWGIVVISGMG